MTIKEVRERLGLTQEELARLINDTEISTKIGKIRRVDKLQISHWETGRRNPNELIKIALKKINILKNKKKV